MANSDSDIVAIMQLVNLYGLAADSQQWQLFDLLSSNRTSRLFTISSMSTHVVDVDGDHAHSFCNGGWRLARKAVDGNPLWDGTGC